MVNSPGVSSISVLKLQAPATRGRQVKSTMIPSGSDHVVEQVASVTAPVVSAPPASDPLPVVPSVPVSAQAASGVQVRGVQAPIAAVSATASVSQPGQGASVSSVPVSAPASLPAPSITPHKEAGPISLTVPAAESVKPVEVVAASEKEVSIPEEVKEVVSVPESAKPLRVSNDLARAGVVLAGASAPVPKTTIGDVKLPMTYADALATEKRTRFWQALHWLAAYIAYQWRKLDPSLKA